jgi:hypothetical protein
MFTPMLIAMRTAILSEKEIVYAVKKLEIGILVKGIGRKLRSLQNIVYR